VLEMEKTHIWAKKAELPVSVGADPIGWIAKFFEVQEIHLFHNLQ